jgi:hypothetical protein
LPDDIRAVFLFGDPYKAVVSTREKRWDRHTWEVNGWFREEPPDIYKRDDLGYEEKFDTWTEPHDYPVLALRYEKMWENLDLLERYLGCPVDLPPKRERSTTVPPHLQKSLEDVYGDLKKKIDAAPDAWMPGRDRSSDISVEDIPPPGIGDRMSIRRARLFAEWYGKCKTVCWVWPKMLGKKAADVLRAGTTISQQHGEE